MTAQSEPRSGERVQPMAKPWVKANTVLSPEGAKEKTCSVDPQDQIGPEPQPRSGGT